MTHDTEHVRHNDFPSRAPGRPVWAMRRARVRLRYLQALHRVRTLWLASGCKYADDDSPSPATGEPRP